MQQYRDPFKKVEERIQTETETRVVEQEQIVASIPTKLSELENDIQLTPETLINILKTATEAEKTQIKSLLGIS